MKADDDDDDEVIVVEETSSKPCEAVQPAADPTDGQVVNLKVRNCEGKERGYRYGMDRPLLKLLETYCRDHDLEVKQVNLVFDGDTLDCHTATPESLDMEDEDVIDVVQAKPPAAKSKAMKKKK